MNTYKYTTGLLIAILILAVQSCEDNSNLQPQDPEFVVPTIVPNGDEKYLTLNSDYIFDQNKLLTFHLNIPASAFAQIDDDPTAEEYVEGMLSFEGDTISPVGVRYKGSLGAFAGCLSGINIFNPSGHKTCTKLSMKVKINWNGRDEKFFGLKKLQFHSQNQDPTQMHDRLGYHLYRAMGVPAPRAVHARLMINGRYYGLYSLVEQVDGRFTRYHFNEGKGNLYKEIWPIDMNGQPFEEAAYLANLQTNEADNPTATLIRSFGQEIANADSVGLRTVITNRMILNEIMAYAVVDRTIKNDDGAFHWYCDGGVSFNHNFYWYESPNAGKLHLIPWDLDNAFENIGENSNNITKVVDDWGVITNDCKPYGGLLGFFKQRSAACDKLTAGWASFDTEYQNLKSQFINGAFSEAAVDALLDTWAAQIRDATIEAEGLYDDALTVSEWEAALDDLKIKLNYARNN